MTKKLIALFLTLCTALGALCLTGCGQQAAAQPSQPVPEIDSAATEASLPLYTPTTELVTERLNISIDAASPTGLSIRFQIQDPPETVQTLQDGSYSLERRTESGWEALTPRMDRSPCPEDPVWSQGDPRYWYDCHVDWTDLYGILAPGCYRIRWELLQGQEPEVIPFTVANSQDPLENQAIDRVLRSLRDLLEQDSYLVRGTFTAHGHAPAWMQFARSGPDYLQFGYHNREGAPNMDSGAMFRDGNYYWLTHENRDTNDSPIHGWEVRVQPPAGSMPGNWVPVLPPLENAEFQQIEDSGITLRFPAGNYDPNAPEGSQLLSFQFDGSGKLKAFRRDICRYEQTAPDYYEARHDLTELEVLDGQEAPALIAAQNPAPPRSFSWEQDLAQKEPETVDFRNTQPTSVRDAAQALRLAMEECTVQYDGTWVYRDPEAGIWKVEFQQMFGLQGYQYIYLDDQGITRMIAAGEPRSY